MTDKDSGSVRERLYDILDHIADECEHAPTFRQKDRVIARILAAFPALADAPREGVTAEDVARLVRAIEWSIQSIVGGITIHDDTPDWSTVVVQDGEVLGRGASVEAALADFAKRAEAERALVTEVVDAPRALPASDAPAAQPRAGA